MYRFADIKTSFKKMSTLYYLFGPNYLLERIKSTVANVIWGEQRESRFSVWYRKYELSEFFQSTDSESEKHKISILIPVFEPKVSHFRKALISIQKQSYGNWEVCIAHEASYSEAMKRLLRGVQDNTRFKTTVIGKNTGIAHSTNAASRIASGSIFVFLDQDDELTPNALGELFDAVSRNPNARYFYSDEVKVSEKGRLLSHHFKSDLNAELSWTYNYFCHLAAIDAKLYKSLGGMRADYEGAQDYDLALRVIDTIPESDIHHIDKILYRWRVHNSSSSSNAKNKTYAVEAGLAALTDRIARTQKSGTVRYSPIRNNQWYEFIPDFPERTPLVSVIILTRNRTDYLKRAVASVIDNNNYDSFELIIVDNASTEKEAIEFLEAIRSDSRVNVVRDESDFNYSKLNNQAASMAQGELLLFLNNDVEALDSNWMNELVREVVQDGVAVSGAKLYYPDGRIQHAGVILGVGGVAGHSHKYAAPGDVGYFGRIEARQQLSAVTGACMMVRREAFLQVGGFTEKLAVSFNDVDLCLKIGATGKRIVYTPRAALVHHESISRGKDVQPEQVSRAKAEIFYMKQKWPEALKRDPFYNINLTRDKEDWSLGSYPKK
jgi:GT2 family glycosyltransferase